MTVHQCSRCELRFSSRAELVDHIDIDHHVPTEQLRRYAYPGTREAEPLYRSFAAAQADVHRVLLVANQTLTEEHLDKLAAEWQARPTAVFVLVPATPVAHLVETWDGYMLDETGQVLTTDLLSGRADDAGVAQARFRLRRALEALGRKGLSVDGAVDDPSPLQAIAHALGQHHFDEIVVSSLPEGASRWLAADLPTAIERRFGLPVRVATAAAPQG